MVRKAEIATYEQAVDYLLALVDHERQVPSLPRQKRIYDLRRVTGLLRLLDNPHLCANTVHIAGTKGKGSTAAMVESVLRAARYRTGFYSSPHLHTFRERIRYEGNLVSEQVFAGLVNRLSAVAQSMEEDPELGAVTLFEFMTGMAFQCFAMNSVDFQVVEVGLGGRLDATNVVESQVCAITSVSLDHMAILGDTIEQIAADKAGIIKLGVPIVLAPQCPEARQVIIDASRDKKAPLVEVGRDITWELLKADITGQTVDIKGRLDNYRVRVPLLGEYQLENAATAIGILECLGEQGHAIGADAIAAGISKATWPCRLELLSRDPLIVADGAHNVYSMERMLATIERYFGKRRLVAIAGFSRDKSVGGMVEALASKADVVIATRSRHPRSTAPSSLVDMMRGAGIGKVRQVENVADALEHAKAEAGPGDLILGTGSLFVAAEVREAVFGIEPELYPDLLPPDLR
jgi:dihydrofolate synthase/folylpolyglutamate synthase